MTNSEDAHSTSNKPAPSTIPDRSRREPAVVAKLLALRERNASPALLRRRVDTLEAENDALREELDTEREARRHADRRAAEWATVCGATEAELAATRRRREWRDWALTACVVAGLILAARFAGGL